MEHYTQTERTTLRRLPKRAHYDRDTVHAILDAGTICHVGYVVNDQPYVTPTMYWRHEDRVYWHGSSASRMLRVLTLGTPVCLTVTHLDGLVLARSAFNHSANYRSVIAFGTAQALQHPAEKMAALKHLTERLFPGRWTEIRQPSDQELKATTVLWLDLEEVSAKVRSGPPVDDEEDYARPVWAGVLPIAAVVEIPHPDPSLAPGIALPPYLADWKLSGV
ncbi:MAG TPA: pyridoxamine 5'-phosphate oxidase family protein [Gemmatimonadaceae bacterium]|nr:pyridoxamine 5'-phosphate oxidase family protein [Gemmatimonadaceae bacterium]